MIYITARSFVQRNLKIKKLIGSIIVPIRETHVNDSLTISNIVPGEG